MDIRKIEGPAGPWKAEEGSSRKTVAPSRQRTKDRVELSSDGVKAGSSGQGIAKLAAASGDVRAEKIEEVKEKVDSGFYDLPETIEKVANRMVEGGFTR